MSDPEYFIGLQNTVAIRKGLLESAKDSVTVLKSQYRLREIRVQKVAYIQQLEKHVSELITLVAGLDQGLPEHKPTQMPEAVQRAIQRIEERKKAQSFRPVKTSAPQIVSKPAPKPTPKPSAPRPDASAALELRELEAKLSDIESKLNKL